jgi:hypothetical protein
MNAIVIPKVDLELEDPHELYSDWSKTHTRIPNLCLVGSIVVIPRQVFRGFKGT